MVLPAIAFTKTGGSVLEVLSKVGSFFVGAKLAMFGLGFFSKHASERGLLIGVAAGFLSLWYVEVYHNIAWPWGGAVSTVVAWVASVLLDGFKTAYSEYRVQGQKALSRARDVTRRRTAGTCWRRRSTGRAIDCSGISSCV